MCILQFTKQVDKTSSDFAKAVHKNMLIGKIINLPCASKEQPCIKKPGLAPVIILIAKPFTKTFMRN